MVVFVVPAERKDNGLMRVCLLRIVAVLLTATLSGCGVGWMLCGDRGVQQWWTMGHGVRCESDVMCDKRWVEPVCCVNNKISKECGGK